MVAYFEPRLERRDWKYTPPVVISRRITAYDVHRLVDRRGEDLDPDRQAEQRRDLERFDGAHEQDQDRGEDRGPRQAQRDAVGHLEDVGPAHHRALLQRRVHGAEGGRHQQEGHRRVVQAVDPDHPRHRIDVEGRRLEPEPRLEREVDEADLGAREQDPRDREQDARDDERDDREREEEVLERRVGALVHPCERGAEQEREDRRARGELD
jgi:hypothetical protein